MSFIEEITPFIERIELHVKGHGRFSKREELIKVRDIHFEYIRSKDFKVPTDINCSSCLGHMMNQLIGEIGRELIKEEKEVRDNTTFTKGSNEPIKTGHKMSFSKVEDKDPLELKELLKDITYVNHDVYTTDNTTRKELVALCKENGIKTGKVKSQSLCVTLNNL